MPCECPNPDRGRVFVFDGASNGKPLFAHVDGVPVAVEVYDNVPPGYRRCYITVTADVNVSRVRRVPSGAGPSWYVDVEPRVYPGEYVWEERITGDGPVSGESA